MAKIKVTQIKSGIGQPERQKRILLALGIKKCIRLLNTKPHHRYWVW